MKEAKEMEHKFDNPEEFFKELEKYWREGYKVDTTANPLTREYTIKTTPITELPK